MNDNQNNKILYGIGGVVIGLIFAALFFPMMRYNGMMSWGNSQNSYPENISASTISADGNHNGSHA